MNTEFAQFNANIINTLTDLSVRLANAGSEEAILQAVATYTQKQNVNELALSLFQNDEYSQPTEARTVAIWRNGNLVKNDPIMRQRFHLNDHPFKDPVLASPKAPLMYENVETDERLDRGFREFILSMKRKSIVFLPLFSNGNWYGVLTIAWHTAHSFTPEEHVVYTSLTQMLAAVVGRYLNSKNAEARTREMEIVAQVTAAAAQRLDIDMVLQETVDLTQKEFNLYHVHIFLVDEEENYLVLAASAPETGLAMKARGYKIRLQFDNSLAAQCGRSRKGMLINDVAEYENFVPNPLLPEIRSEMVVPLMLENRLIGVINLQASSAHRFNNSILSVMVILGQQLAIAIQNARLFAQQLAVAERLREVDKLKSQFLANMSHELRTPLNAILNFTRFVATGMFGPVNPEQEENLQKVTASAVHLLGLINDILDLSKIEAGMMNLFVEKVDMGELVQGVIATANGIERHEGVGFVTEIGTSLPVLQGDKRRIRQVLLNLLSNAAKFTESGEIKFRVDHDERLMHFSVTDTGPGIPPNQIDLIFQPFRQTEEGLSKGGTGLGLPISRYLAEAHGGRLWVESKVGSGTTFYVELPIETNIVRKYP